MGRILVVGGSGFIGSHVVRCALQKRFDVEVMDKKGNKLPVKTTIVDIRRKSVQSLDLSRFDLVIIESACTSQLEFERRSSPSFETNVDGTFNILEACKHSKVPKILFASSSAVYGNTLHKTSEDSPLDPRNMYAVSKVIGEQLVRQYVHKGYFDAVIVRYFNTYGVGENSKGDYKSIISIFLMRRVRWSNN